jgi:protein involved in polysaccharide export with SLBB domain
MRRCLVVLFLIVQSLAVLAAPPRTSKVKVGDVLTIAVTGVKEYSGDYTVSADGRLSGPGFGVVRVEGLTLEGTRDVLRKALAKRLVDPFVEVFFKQQQPDVVYLVNVGGSIDTPVAPFIGAQRVSGGTVRWVPEMTLRKVLATTTLPATPDQTLISVTRSDKTVLSEVATEILRVGSKGGDFAVEPEDVVTITIKPYIRIWVIGAVTDPGQKLLEEGSTASKAFALAGIFNSPYGDRGIRLVLRRGPELTQLPMRISEGQQDVVLQSGDVLVAERVPTTRFTVSGEISNPNEYEMVGPVDLLSAVTRAGGPNSLGTLSTVLVLRGTEAFRVDLTAVMNGVGREKFIVNDRDQIIVLKNDRRFSVLGAVQRGGLFTIPDGVTYNLSEAVSLAGGPVERGSLREVFIARADAKGKITLLKVNLDEYIKSGNLLANPIVQPNDVILLRTSKSNMFDDLNKLLSPLLLLDALIRRR